METTVNKNLSHNLYSEECKQDKTDNQKTSMLHVDIDLMKANLMKANGLNAEEYIKKLQKRTNGHEKTNFQNTIQKISRTN